MSRTLIVIGLCIVLIGLLWPWLSKLPFGQLPGDIAIRRENFSFYFPVTTMILLSVLLSALLWLFSR
ncbi:DUF2905 domain-containing protein [Billgrantia ethanolica]|uniref:DUF2905 domain-containing protein n=1 Tax=Billgrantia ethanolica TaxID=2733486 RepID=A0ABS9A6Q5_9GAMM|nr:DUF2905 domain-containing protein [Halomonas ethanolica]MCE8003735.1 DUF2905 domain-containing protein [Halomonas ethanolica]